MVTHAKLDYAKAGSGGPLCGNRGKDGANRRPQGSGRGLRQYVNAASHVNWGQEYPKGPPDQKFGSAAGDHVSQQSDHVESFLTVWSKTSC